MRKTILGALISGAFAFCPAHAGLLLDLNGTAAGGLINADALDWAPTSFLALGGNTAISNFNAGTCAGSACNFDVLTSAKLTAYKPAGGSSFTGLPAAGGEITMIARYTETVTGFGTIGTNKIATFSSTGNGWVEFYYSSAADAADLTGSGFNNGTLIGRLTGLSPNQSGQFSVDTTKPTVALDQFDIANGTGDQYTGQLTVQGSGSQSTLDAGLTSVDLDSDFFKTLLTGFSLNYTNISIGLPYESVQPADCFNPNQAAGAVGTSGLTGTCSAGVHVNGTYAAQGPDGNGGVVPSVGPVNGLALGDPDFVAQTDFNSSVTGATPEPGSIALVGLALAGVGAASLRRRNRA